MYNNSTAVDASLLISRMEDLKLTRSQLARKINVHPSSITNWVNGRNKVTPIHYAALREALNLKGEQTIEKPKKTKTSKDPVREAIIDSLLTHIDGMTTRDLLGMYETLICK